MRPRSDFRSSRGRGFRGSPRGRGSSSFRSYSSSNRGRGSSSSYQDDRRSPRSFRRTSYTDSQDNFRDSRPPTRDSRDSFRSERPRRDYDSTRRGGRGGGRPDRGRRDFNDHDRSRGRDSEFADDSYSKRNRYESMSRPSDRFSSGPPRDTYRRSSYDPPALPSRDSHFTSSKRSKYDDRLDYDDLLPPRDDLDFPSYSDMPPRDRSPVDRFSSYDRGSSRDAGLSGPSSYRGKFRYDDNPSDKHSIGPGRDDLDQRSSFDRSRRGFRPKRTNRREFPPSSGRGSSRSAARSPPPRFSDSYDRYQGSPPRRF